MKALGSIILSLVMIIGAMPGGAQPVLKQDTTIIISEYDLEVKYPSMVFKAAAKAKGFNPQKLVLEEFLVTSDGQEIEFSLRVSTDDGRVWLQAFSDTSRFSFTELPFQTQDTLGTDTIQFIKDLRKLAALDYYFVYGPVTLGRLKFDAAAYYDSPFIKEELGPELERVLGEKLENVFGEEKKHESLRKLQDIFSSIEGPKVLGVYVESEKTKYIKGKMTAGKIEERSTVYPVISLQFTVKRVKVFFSRFKNVPIGLKLKLNKVRISKITTFGNETTQPDSN